jgi:hypothetical protein
MVRYENVIKRDDGALVGQAVYLGGYSLPFYAAPQSALHKEIKLYLEKLSS